MIQLVIFDMDGTLADTSAGIYNCHRYAHRMMKREEPTDGALDGVIGGPLFSTYLTHFGFSHEAARCAVDYYRLRYAEQGIYEARFYSGMEQALVALKQSGVRLGVATLKADRFVKSMLSEMGIFELFDVIVGMDEADTRTKTDLIRMCVERTGVSLEQTVMIGDSIHDLHGARESGVAFIGVTYGFGFKSKNEIMESGAIAAADDCSELNLILRGIHPELNESR